jgi:hypothetical protein
MTNRNCTWTRITSRRTRSRSFLGAVQIKKSYVSFHLMPVCVKPALLNELAALTQAARAIRRLHGTHLGPSRPARVEGSAEGG